MFAVEVGVRYEVGGIGFTVVGLFELSSPTKDAFVVKINIGGVREEEAGTYFKATGN